MELRTARLRLRPLGLGDVSRIFAMSQEAGVRRWLPDQVYSDEAHAADVVRALATLADPRQGPLVLGVEEDGALIGHVGLSPWRGSVEVGFAIADARQGKGFAAEAVAALIDWALQRLPELLGIVAVENLPSQRVLEKSGFTRIGEDRGRLIYRRGS